MSRVRVIPVLLLQEDGLVKSVKFKNHKYVGDPINAVKIFNDKEVDEIAIIDIEATVKGRKPDFKFIEQMASEAFMPLSYGGGIQRLDDIRKILYHGAEKVILQSALWEFPEMVKSASRSFGSQSIVAAVDYRKNWLGKMIPVSHRGDHKLKTHLDEWVLHLQDMGVGEIILQSIDREGTFTGYDLDTIAKLSEQLSIPIVALGGASQLSDMKEAINAGASAVAAGSFFIFQMPHRAVLISYPSQKKLKNIGLI